MMGATRVALVAAVAAFLCVSVSSYPYSTTVANKLFVTWSPIPGGLFQRRGFYKMPRTTAEATEMEFAQEGDRSAIDKTTVWCRQKDYRVCLLFDRKGNVAGIQVSHSVEEILKTNVPKNLDEDPHWFRQNVTGTHVYSTITYFVDDATLQNGGRDLNEDTLTAPNGIRVLETRGGQLSSMNVPLQEEGAPSLGFVKQGCFLGMGQHYYHELNSTSKCEKSRPYFTLYGKKTKTLHGFGVTAFGQISSGARTWFEKPIALTVKLITPNSPPCLTEWLEKYTRNTFHVFFIPSPWFITCTTLF